MTRAQHVTAPRGTWAITQPKRYFLRSGTNSEWKRLPDCPASDFYLSIFLRFEKQSSRERSSSSAGSLPKWLQRLWLSQAEARRLQLGLGLPLGWQGPTTELSLLPPSVH